MKLTAEGKENYLRTPDKCPFCQSNDLVTGDYTPGATWELLRLEVSCRKCGQEWTETFKLVDVTHTSEDDSRPRPTQHIPGYG